MTAGRKFDVRLKSSRLYQVDGGDRTKVQRLKIRVEPDALLVSVPNEQVH